MTPRIKVLLVMAAVLAGIALAGWTGTFFYWHIRIGRTIRYLETRRMGTGARPPDVCEAHDFLVTTKCRAVPYLAAELDPKKIPEFYYAASFIIAWRVVECEVPSRSWQEEHHLRIRQQAIQLEDSPETIQRKMAHLRSWWNEHGGKHHPWWRVWSFECESAR